MKKAAFIVTILFLTFLVSCAPKVSPLAYQSGIESASCVLAFEEGTYGVIIYPAEKKLSVTSPERIAGTVLAVSGEKYTLTAGETVSGLDPSFIPLIAPVLDSFSLSDETAKIMASDGSGRTVKVKTGGGEYEIKISADGTPAEIKYTGERDFTMTGIEIK